MLFNKKNKSKCIHCEKQIEGKFTFCPYCGRSLKTPEQIQKEFGILGNSDNMLADNPMASAGMLGGILAPMMQGLAKSLMETLSNSDTEITEYPNGLSIKLGKSRPKKKQQKPSAPEITEEQIKRITSLPKAQAKTSTERFSDKLLYTLEAPGVQTIEDIIVSKLESGYEVKAITKNKVYTNSISINLPLKKYSFDTKSIIMEFGI